MKTELKTISLCILCLLISSSCSHDGHDAETESLLCRLDSVTEQHSYRIEQKEKEIAKLKKRVYPSASADRYRAYDALIDAYYTIDLDSAERYGELKAEAAESTGDRHLQAIANISLGRIRIAAGKIAEAMNLINSSLPDTIHDDVRNLYYETMAYGEEQNGGDPLIWYLARRKYLIPGETSWIYNEFNYLKATGNYLEADSLLTENAGKLGDDIHTKAIFNHLLAENNLLAGDTAKAMKQLAISAYYDLKTPVRDYKSLYRLASLLFETGDAQRAYRYINLALEDAEASKVFANRVAVGGIMPEIIKAYDIKKTEQEHRDTVRMWILIVLSGMLVVALAVVLRSMRIMKSISDREKNLNTILQKNNQKLQLLNGKLKESNKVKDAYLLQYIDLCSDFVGNIEQFKTGVSTSLRTRGEAGVEKYLAKIDNKDEIKKFHSNFDTTFLSLFPDFIERVNRLLQPDKQLELSRDGSMTTELRVLALIRLGINDSDKIAVFLRKSVSTIYNSRVRIRNSALENRDEIESKIMEIG